MSKSVSPFAELTGAEKQIRWLEYQSVRLPYIKAGLEDESESKECISDSLLPEKRDQVFENKIERPQPPPEVPRIFPADQLKPRHSHYDAVIARLKQAEIQARNYSNVK